MADNSSDNSAILGLPYIQPSQAQKHVTHNEALTTLDVLVQLSVAGFDATTPPVDPGEGETHALGLGPTDAWAGQDDMLASWHDGIWVFITPLAGWRAYGVGEGELRIWDGTAWTLPLGAADNLDGIGINTTHDATNRLAVSSDATLLTHDGTGHQLKVNKATGPDTASLLFQSGFTGHAEMGLSGSIDFAIKVSDDGTNWNEALSIDAASGNVGISVPNPSVRLHLREDTDATASVIESTHASLSTRILDLRADRAGSNAFDFARFSSGGTADAEFRFSGDGNGTCDGSWSGGGADYAEYFEWADGNPTGEDRRGLAVVLMGDEIREARPGEAPIGVISGNPSMVGDAAALRWNAKYLRDDFGTALLEDYDAVSWVGPSGETDEDGQATLREVAHSYDASAVPQGITVPQDAIREGLRRRLPNPDYDPGQPYTPRAARAEWDTVGLIGKLRLRKGQVTGAAWVKMRDVSDLVEEWLVR